jgi:two-component system sensor histidine kinase DevS
MTWIWTKWLFATGISLVVCRALIELLARVDPCMRLDTAIGLLIESTLLALLVLGFGTQLAGEQRVMRAERERIASDLHDGLGFHLTTALSLAGDARKADSEAWLIVELALVELHSVIHFAHSGGESVVQSLGSLRYRLQKVVDREGVELVWQVRHDIPDDVLTGAPAYHFIKIVQEALSNVLQHARATRLIVQVGSPAPGRMLMLRIVDNGRGITQRDLATHGRGMEGMSRRARLLGAKLTIEPVPEGGTCIRLSVPLPCRASDP